MFYEFRSNNLKYLAWSLFNYRKNPKECQILIYIHEMLQVKMLHFIFMKYSSNVSLDICLSPASIIALSHNLYASC